jgi:hypothetical protein
MLRGLKGVLMNPYKQLPQEAFWKTAVANRHMLDISGLWKPKFKILQDEKVATFGSCFAEHIGRALKARGFNWFCSETPPSALNSEGQKKFNYNIFSARTANIYTTSLLEQWVSWSTNSDARSHECWQNDGRFYDPFRPIIEPRGFSSEQELIFSREATYQAFVRCIKESTYFVFTLGLTESWFNSDSGYEYPMCPGTAAGSFDADKHQFVNQDYTQVRTSLLNAISMMRVINPKLKFILTVSPVSLTATKSGNHVLVATMESKSTLRAVAGDVARSHDFVDYFPSYEIINSPVFKGAFFEPNQRSVSMHGVNFVMNSFFAGLVDVFGAYMQTDSTAEKEEVQKSKEDILCEEEILGSFENKTGRVQ